MSGFAANKTMASPEEAPAELFAVDQIRVSLIDQIDDPRRVGQA